MAKVKITSACLDGVNGDERGMGIDLVVCLSNSALVNVVMDAKNGDPLFKEIIYELMQNKDCDPKTDGERVYWPNGAYITLAEIFEMAQTGK